MNKTKFLYISLSILVVLNITTIFMLLKNDHPHHRPKDRVKPKNHIIQQLKFDENQIKEYEKSIKIHFNGIKNAETELRNLKNELFSQLINTDETKKTEIISKISEIQSKIENIHFKHFMEIKKICRKDQIDDFKKLTKDLAKLFSPHHPPKKLP